MELINLSAIKQSAKKTEKESIRFGKWLKKHKPSDLDYVIKKIGEQVFDHITCLKCANCCQTLGPRITLRDIANISKHLRMSEKQLIDKYLTIDQDNDYVFKTMPCPFLDHQHHCTIYNQRPQACKEYPHFEHRKFVQIIDITIKNRSACPAVLEAFELLKKHYKQ